MTRDEVSGEEPGASERLNDAIDHARNLVERGNNRLTLDSINFAERYRKGEMWLYVHIRQPLEMHAGDLCAILHNGSGATLHHIEAHDRGAAKDFGVQAGKGVGDGDEHMMLVLIGQDIEHPEKVVPSLVRLEYSQNIYRRLPRSLFYSIKTGFKLVGTLEDGEAILAPSVLAVTMQLNNPASTNSRILRNMRAP